MGDGEFQVWRIKFHGRVQRCGAPAEGSPRRQPWDHVEETKSPGRGGRGVAWGLAHAEPRRGRFAVGSQRRREDGTWFPSLPLL